MPRATSAAALIDQRPIPPKALLLAGPAGSDPTPSGNSGFSVGQASDIAGQGLGHGDLAVVERLEEVGERADWRRGLVVDVHDTHRLEARDGFWGIGDPLAYRPASVNSLP